MHIYNIYIYAFAHSNAEGPTLRRCRRIRWRNLGAPKWRLGSC